MTRWFVTGLFQSWGGLSNILGEPLSPCLAPPLSLLLFASLWFCTNDVTWRALCVSCAANKMPAKSNFCLAVIWMSHISLSVSFCCGHFWVISGLNNFISNQLPCPCPPIDNIWVMGIVWRLRGNIIRTTLCWIVWHNVHSQKHT